MCRFYGMEMNMKVLFVSLGCDKNLVDSEEMLGLLKANGYFLTDDEAEADAVVINTCCFINDAKDESIQTILEMAELKKAGRIRALIVTGCLAQRYRREIMDEIPEVDGVIGTSAYDSIVSVLNKALDGGTSMEIAPLDRLPEISVSTKRVVTTGGYSSYLKIAEGCDKHCTYCIIPSLRGRYRSIPMERLLNDAKELAAQGVRELILVAQETTVYGRDIYGKKMLPELLKRLCEIEGLRWIRVLYCYPEEITEELIEVIASEEKICHYLDIPIQHANDEVLKRMGRRTNQAELRSVIGRLRERIPDIALRTTLIAGFPGETEEQHEEMLDFVDEMEFERLGVFPYSAEEGTPAAEFPNQVDEDVKSERRDALMELQQEIAFSHSEDMVGRELTVLIEGYLPEDRVYVGRTYMDAPGVDGSIFVTSEEELLSGDFIKAEVTGASGYDLVGSCIDKYFD